MGSTAHTRPRSSKVICWMYFMLPTISSEAHNCTFIPAAGSIQLMDWAAFNGFCWVQFAQLLELQPVMNSDVGLVGNWLQLSFVPGAWRSSVGQGPDFSTGTAAVATPTARMQ